MDVHNNSIVEETKDQLKNLKENLEGFPSKYQTNQIITTLWNLTEIYSVKEQNWFKFGEHRCLHSRLSWRV